MSLRVGILSAAHVHTGSYVHCFRLHPDVEIIGLWDDDEERGRAFAERNGIPFGTDLDSLLTHVDAVVITAENLKHAQLVELAARAGKHILCEKPLAASEEEGTRIRAAIEASGVKLMTAFPCRYSPAFQRLLARVEAGEIGPVRAVCATNRGSCPGGWFTQPELSGGGAMIDHVVHVADLLRVLLKSEPRKVQAQTGSNVYGQEWDDTAMLTIEFDDGIFATLDSSWSRPSSYKTWGDVTLNVVGEGGVIELDMFGPGVDVYSDEGKAHTVAGYVSSLDEAMVNDFVRSVLEDAPVPIGLEDGLQAARVAIKGYESVRLKQPVSI